MQSFEDVRASVAVHHALVTSEPYLLSFEVSLDGGARRQGMFLAELETEDGRKLLRISTPIARLARVNAEKCLRFNWAQRAGFLAVGQLEKTEYLHLCENRTYGSLDDEELQRLLAEMSTLADQLEVAFNAGRDLA